MTYELQPFNQSRFDACMAWVAKQFDRTLSQYEAVKIHALADALHVVKHYRPIIGGTFKKLPKGPVALPVLDRAKGWKNDRSAPMELKYTQNKAFHYAPKSGPTREGLFTPSEREAILEAARIIFSMRFDVSQRFFHGESGDGNYLGQAWRNTPRDNAPITWESIVDAYAAQTGADAGQLKALICCE